MRQQPFASPEEALEHFGIKGMKWGVRKDQEYNANLPTAPYASAAGIGHGDKDWELRKQDELVMDASKGYTDVVPAKGYSSPLVKQHHDELTSAIEELRSQYPALQNLKIEVCPMSHTPGMKPFLRGKSSMAAVPGKNGEVRLCYNDKLKRYSSYQNSYRGAMQPGVLIPKFSGRHEMGHILAMADGKTFPPAWDAEHGGLRAKIAYSKQRNAAHRAMLEKHGLSFKELSKLSPYACTMPEEALAELAGHYFTPSLRTQMSPDMQRKAESLFADLGGKR